MAAPDTDAGAERAETPAFTPSLPWRAAATLGGAGAVIVIDQLTKAVVRAAAAAGGGVWTAELIPGVLGLRFVRNTGAAFSLGEGFSGALVVLAVAVVIAMTAYLARTRLVSRVEVAGLAMVAGGAVGNALDRLLFGFVTDFFATEFMDFAVFNVADIGITVGVVVAFIGFAFLSPANRVDATAELNRRDAAAAARRAERGRRG